MSRRTYVIALAACLPAGALLELATHRNALAETIVVTAIVTSSASAGWYGPKAAIERRRIPVAPPEPEPGPGRRRAQSGDTMAVRPHAAPGAEPYRGPAEPEELPAAEPAALADAATMVDSAQAGPAADPYLYTVDDATDTQQLDLSQLPDLNDLREDDFLAARGIWSAAVS